MEPVGGGALNKAVLICSQPVCPFSDLVVVVVLLSALLTLWALCSLLRCRKPNLGLDLILRKSVHNTKACQKGVLSYKPLRLIDVSMLGKRVVAVIKELE